MPDSPRTGPPGHHEDLPLGPRPYALTRGRTRPDLHLALEALVSTTAGADEPPRGTHRAQRAQRDALGPEHHAIQRLCREPRSVAEIAALLSVPLGVARILVADLAGAGLVVIEQTVASTTGQPDTLLLERVLGGLRNL
ncbi:DUF742 domain-containing protein [Kitasatospora sp. NPDC101176]|uniref:DUF742 domain-containing protein n=1 Tax=Kitasatospora sp. NPDC101176 TaxID=3364099 RepID=UPI003803733F